MTTTTAPLPTTTPCAGHCCGGKCGGELVAVLTSPAAKTVRFAPCSVLLGQGWIGPHQVAVAKTDTRGLARWGVAL